MRSSTSRGQVSLALIIVIVLVLVGIAFYLGYAYRAPGNSASVTTTVTTSTSTDTTSSDPYSNTASWQTATNSRGGFTLSYPLDFDANNSESVSPSTDWRLDSTAPGTLAFTLTVPKAFEPQTNFADAKLTVGYSANDVALRDCYTPTPSAGPASISTTTLNGITYQVLKGSGAGAGNYYDTTSYRTMHAGKCYVIEYTVHSTQLANYPASYHLTQFDEAKVTQVLDRVVSTFSFK